MLLLLAIVIGAKAQDHIVADGTSTSSLLPINGSMFGFDQHSQIIYSESMLNITDGAIINTLEFYLATPPYWNTSEQFTIRIGQVNETEFASNDFFANTDFTIVYQGGIVWDQDNNKIIFDIENYTYNGGNLILDFQSNTDVNAASWTSASYYGQHQSANTSITWCNDWDNINILHSFIPKTNFVLQASCPVPEDLTISQVTTTSANLSWTIGNEESAWVVRYGVQGFDVTTGTDINVNTTSYNLTGLTVNTAYDVYVKAICGENSESEWQQITFRTACDAHEITATTPLTETFDDADLGCWTVINNSIAANQPEVTNFYSKNVLRFSSYGTATNYDQYLISQELIASEEFVFSFEYATLYDGEKFKVGYSTTTNEISAFTWSDEYIPSPIENGEFSSFKEFYPATTKYLAIQYCPGASLYYLNIANIAIRVKSSEKNILTFELAEQTSEAVIDNSVPDFPAVECEVLNSADITSLTPTITVSPYATINPNSETTQDFTNAVIYTVTAEDGSTKEWIVIVTQATANTDALITRFEFEGEKDGTTAVIDNDNFTISAVAEWNVDLETIEPEVTYSQGATLTSGNDETVDFTRTLTYTVISEDQQTENTYTVTIINDPDTCVSFETWNDPITVSNITETSATLSWERQYREESYYVKIYKDVAPGDNFTETNLIYDETVESLQLNLTDLVVDTKYFVYVYPNCGEGFTPDELTYMWARTTFTTGICIPTPTSVYGEGITFVSFPGIENTDNHPTASPYYANNTSMSTTEIEAGTSVNFSVKYSTDGYQYYTAVWVNWNNDLEFSESERIYAGQADESGQTNATFFIPANTPAGSYRMRIGGFGSYDYDPCYSSMFAVFEDYTLVVTPSTTTPSTYTITATAGNGGTINPNGTINVNEGDYQTFSITANNGYEIENILIDDVAIQVTGTEYSYTFNAVDANHTIHANFIQVTAIDELENVSLSVYPNPNNGFFTIDFSAIEGKATYQLINVNGSVIDSREINGNTINFNYDLNAGTYFVRIITNDNVYVEQIVVE